MLFSSVIVLAILAIRVQSVHIFGNDSVSEVFTIRLPQDIEIDLFIFGNFLISTASELITTDFTTSQTLHSSTADRYFVGIVQQSPTELLFADLLASCILSMDRTTGNVVTYAGSCGSSGTMTGHRLSARFNIIFDIKMIEPSLLLVVDSYSDRLVYINLKTEQVSLAISGGYLDHPSLISLHPTNSKIIYLAIQNMIVEINLDTQQQSLFAGGNSLADGDLATAGFTTSVRSLKFVNKNQAILVADKGGGLRLIDLMKNEVSTLCRPGSNTNGVFGVCKLPQPRELLVVRGKVYITHTHGISLLEAHADTIIREKGNTALFGIEACASSCGFSQVINNISDMDCAWQCLRSKSCDNFQYKNEQCYLMISECAQYHLVKDETCYTYLNS